jgi:hypothetical protein
VTKNIKFHNFSKLRFLKRVYCKVSWGFVVVVLDVFLGTLGFELRTSDCYEATPTALFSVGYFQDWFSQTIFLGWL